VIEKRRWPSVTGFHTACWRRPPAASAANTELRRQSQPGDLIRYGLIPEFVGPPSAVAGSNEATATKGRLLKILTENKKECPAGSAYRACLIVSKKGGSGSHARPLSWRPSRLMVGS